MSWQQNETPSSNIPFMWIAKYKDDSYILEYNDDKKETSFNDIIKENVKEFYIIGRKQRFGFNTADGVFKIFNDKFEFYIEDKENKNIKLTNRSNTTYNDIIQYKGGYADLIPNSNQKSLQMITNSYHIGWKKNIDTEFGRLHFKAIFKIELGKGIEMQFKVTPQFNFAGKLFIRRNGEVIHNFDLDIQKGTSQNLSIEFALNK